MPTLQLVQDPAADALLEANPFALLVGMLLDQQVPMEWAFTGPATLKARLGHLDAKKIAAMDVESMPLPSAGSSAVSSGSTPAG